MNRKTVWLVTRRYAAQYALWLLIAKPFLVTLFQLPGPWGPTLIATLPRGDRFELRCRRWGRETDEILVHTDARGREEFAINNTHALGLSYARICVDEANTFAWVESRSAVMGTLELQTRKFWREGLQQPVQFGSGRVLAEGMTLCWWELLLPL